MKPLKIRMRNFTVYENEEVEFHDGLVALTGENGTGKSSLIEAITWAVWGKSRLGKAAADFVRIGKSWMSVDFIFSVRHTQRAEEHVYRILRRLEKRPKKEGGYTTTMSLFLYEILNYGTPNENEVDIGGKSIRQTQEVIVERVGMDFDTFLASAYLMQGQVDLFSRMGPAARKEIIARILGLERWREREKQIKGLRSELKAKLQSAQAEVAAAHAKVEDYARDVAILLSSPLAKSGDVEDVGTENAGTGDRSSGENEDEDEAAAMLSALEAHLNRTAGEVERLRTERGTKMKEAAVLEGRLGEVRRLLRHLRQLQQDLHQQEMEVKALEMDLREYGETTKRQIRLFLALLSKALSERTLSEALSGFEDGAERAGEGEVREGGGALARKVLVHIRKVQESIARLDESLSAEGEANTKTTIQTLEELRGELRALWVLLGKWDEAVKRSGLEMKEELERLRQEIVERKRQEAQAEILHRRAAEMRERILAQVKMEPASTFAPLLHPVVLALWMDEVETARDEKLAGLTEQITALEEAVLAAQAQAAHSPQRLSVRDFLPVERRRWDAIRRHLSTAKDEVSATKARIESAMQQLDENAAARDEKGASLSSASSSSSSSSLIFTLHEADEYSGEAAAALGEALDEMAWKESTEDVARKVAGKAVGIEEEGKKRVKAEGKDEGEGKDGHGEESASIEERLTSLRAVKERLSQMSSEEMVAEIVRRALRRKSNAAPALEDAGLGNSILEEVIEEIEARAKKSLEVRTRGWRWEWRRLRQQVDIQSDTPGREGRRREDDEGSGDGGDTLTFLEALSLDFAFLEEMAENERRGDDRRHGSDEDEEREAERLESRLQDTRETLLAIERLKQELKRLSQRAVLGVRTGEGTAEDEPTGTIPYLIWRVGASSVSLLQVRLREAQKRAVQTASEVASLEVQIGGGSQWEEEERRVRALRGEIDAISARVERLSGLLARGEALRTSFNEALAEARRREEEVERLTQELAAASIVQEAFGVRGIPGLLIEAAVPLLESEANNLLRLLSDELSVELQTTRTSNNGRVHETLEIRVWSHGVVRSYDSFSGGEKFLVGFALRIALSVLLASRNGVQLQALFIDEAFSSLDEVRRQQLINALYRLTERFPFILVISHIPEIQDAFPEVLMTEIVEETRKQAGETEEDVIVPAARPPSRIVRIGDR